MFADCLKPKYDTKLTKYRTHSKYVQSENELIKIIYGTAPHS